MSDIFQDVVTPLFHEKNLVCNEDEMCGILKTPNDIEWKATLRTRLKTLHYYGEGWYLLRKLLTGDFAFSLICQNRGLTSLRICC